MPGTTTFICKLGVQSFSGRRGFHFYLIVGNVWSRTFPSGKYVDVTSHLGTSLIPAMGPWYEMVILLLQRMRFKWQLPTEMTA